MQAKDLTGIKFNELTVLYRAGSNARGKALWVCSCSCGGTVTIPSDVIAAKRQRSCGCLRYEGFAAEHKRRTRYATLADLLANCTPVGTCLEWRGYISPRGYAHSGGPLHRRVYKLSTGDAPQVVMHTCDNPKCINPAHLKGGTPATNTADMMAKGRYKGGPNQPNKRSA